MKTEFEMKLWNDSETRRKVAMLNCLETLFDRFFDHSNNPLPEDYFWFGGNLLPVGSRVKITFEVVE